MLRNYFWSVVIGVFAMLPASSADAAPNWRFPFRTPFRLFDRLTPRHSRHADRRPTMVDMAGLAWHANYQRAWQEAQASKKMLLIVFGNRTPSKHLCDVVGVIRRDEQVAKRLQTDFVLAYLPRDAQICVQGKSVNLLRHRSMAEMHGFEGIAIVDLKNKGQEYYGFVVSSYPFMQGKYYRFRASDLATIVNLPPGTITQRTMIWAVRVHPEHPASTRGQRSVTLVSEAKSHSRYQAAIGVQGHHHWETRFHRILGRLGGGGPVEVVAESWPNQTMIDSCVDCVASWRQSDGHWNAVRSFQSIYGYDIKRGGNGIWYGTGIFAK